MSYRFEVDPESKIRAVRFEGEISFDELKRFYFSDAPKYVSEDMRGSVVDFSNATMPNITPMNVRELAAQPPVDPDATRLRVVVAPTPHIFGLLRAFELYGDETRPNFHVVSSLRQAYSLLGITAPRFEPVEAKLSSS